MNTVNTIVRNDLQEQTTASDSYDYEHGLSKIESNIDKNLYNQTNCKIMELKNALLPIVKQYAYKVRQHYSIPIDKVSVDNPLLESQLLNETKPLNEDEQLCFISMLSGSYNIYIEEPYDSLADNQFLYQSIIDNIDKSSMRSSRIAFYAKNKYTFYSLNNKSSLPPIKRFHLTHICKEEIDRIQKAYSDDTSQEKCQLDTIYMVYNELMKYDIINIYKFALQSFIWMKNVLLSIKFLEEHNLITIQKVSPGNFFVKSVYFAREHNAMKLTVYNDDNINTLVRFCVNILKKQPNKLFSTRGFGLNFNLLDKFNFYKLKYRLMKHKRVKFIPLDDSTRTYYKFQWNNSKKWYEKCSFKNIGDDVLITIDRLVREYHIDVDCVDLTIGLSEICRVGDFDMKKGNYIPSDFVRIPCHYLKDALPYNKDDFLQLMSSLEMLGFFRIKSSKVNKERNVYLVDWLISYIDDIYNDLKKNIRPMTDKEKPASVDKLLEIVYKRPINYCSDIALDISSKHDGEDTSEDDGFFEDNFEDIDIDDDAYDDKVLSLGEDEAISSLSRSNLGKVMALIDNSAPVSNGTIRKHKSKPTKLAGKKFKSIRKPAGATRPNTVRKHGYVFQPRHIEENTKPVRPMIQLAANMNNSNGNNTFSHQRTGTSNVSSASSASFIKERTNITGRLNEKMVSDELSNLLFDIVNEINDKKGKETDTRASEIWEAAQKIVMSKFFHSQAKIMGAWKK